MECYTSSGTFCDTWLFRKASCNTKFSHPESGNWTTGSLSFTTSCNFRSPALWQRQIQVSAPWRSHCALLCERFWRVMLPKLGELPEAGSLWQCRAWGAACSTGQENNMTGPMPRIPSWAQWGNQVSDAIPKHSVCSSQTSLGCSQRNIPTVMSIAVYRTGQKTHWAMTTTIKRKPEKDYNRIFLLIQAIPRVRSAENLSVDQLQWLFSTWQGNVLCLLFSLPHLLMLSLLSWQSSIFACILQLGNTRFWNSVFLSIYIILVTRQNLILSDVKMMR